jgi:hypothetical protein
MRLELQLKRSRNLIKSGIVYGIRKVMAMLTNIHLVKAQFINSFENSEYVMLP